MKRLLPIHLFANFRNAYYILQLKQAVCAVVVLLVSTGSFSQSTAPSKDAAYLQTITQRSNKIVAVLGIADSSKFYRVQNIMVQQYNSLNSLHETFNTNAKTIKKDSTLDKKTISEKVMGIEEKRTALLVDLHKNYLQKLATELNGDQITKVKDGMTYNKVAVTYNAYVAMIPALTEEQKAKIHGYLVEAREIAMDAESADKKTEWFGKYKGRINNYLSTQGYDVKKEGEQWQERIKAAKASNQ